MSAEPTAETVCDDDDDEEDKGSVTGTVTVSEALLVADVVGDAGSLVDVVVVTVLLAESADVEVVELPTVEDVVVNGVSPGRELTAALLLLLVSLMALLLLLLVLPIVLEAAASDELDVVDDEDARRWSSARDGAVVATAAPA